MKKLLLLTLITLPIFSQAADKGWTQISHIKELVITAGGGLNIRLSPDLTGCVSQSGYGEKFASVLPNHVGIDRIQSLVLTAYTTGKRVRLYFDNHECYVREIRLSD